VREYSIENIKNVIRPDSQRQSITYPEVTGFDDDVQLFIQLAMKYVPGTWRYGTPGPFVIMDQKLLVRQTAVTQAKLYATFRHLCDAPTSTISIEDRFRQAAQKASTMPADLESGCTTTPASSP
jgi:hypothetical protein